jgi:hypothetical protein
MCRPHNSTRKMPRSWRLRCAWAVLDAVVKPLESVTGKLSRQRLTFHMDVWSAFPERWHLAQLLPAGHIRFDAQRSSKHVRSIIHSRNARGLHLVAWSKTNR